MFETIKLLLYHLRNTILDPTARAVASYEIEDGSLIGNRENKAHTDECIELGWKPPEPRTEFDVLPVVIEDTISGLVQMSKSH